METNTIRRSNQFANLMRSMVNVVYANATAVSIFLYVCRRPFLNRKEAKA